MNIRELLQQYYPVWIEDGTTIHDPDHESLDAAWERLYGQPLYLSATLAVHDLGDCTVHVMPDNRIVIVRYPGGNEIRKLRT